MSYKTTLGYVYLLASDVRDRAEDALKRISDSRAERREEFLKNIMAPCPRFFGGFTKSRTREEAMEYIKSNAFVYDEWWYMSDNYESPKQASLKTLINVASGLLEGGNNSMQVTIEAAEWLYPNEV